MRHPAADPCSIHSCLTRQQRFLPNRLATFSETQIMFINHKIMDIMSFYVQLTFVYYEQNVQVNQPYIKPKLIGQTIGKTSRTTLTKYMNELVENKY